MSSLGHYRGGSRGFDALDIYNAARRAQPYVSEAYRAGKRKLDEYQAYRAKRHRGPPRGLRGATAGPKLSPARANAIGLGTTVATTGRGVSRVRRRRRHRRKKLSLRKRVGKLETKVPKLSVKVVQVMRSGQLFGSLRGFATYLNPGVSPVALPVTNDTAYNAYLPGSVFCFDRYSDVTSMFADNKLGKLLYFDHALGDTSLGTVDPDPYVKNWISMKKDPLENWLTLGTSTTTEVYGDQNQFRWGVYRKFRYYNNQEQPVYLQFNELRPKDPTSDSPVATAEDQLNGNAIRNYAYMNTEATSNERDINNSEYKLPSYNIFTLSDVKKRWHLKTRVVCIQPGGHYTYTMKNAEKNFNYRSVRKEHTESGSDTNEYLPALGSTFLAVRQWGSLGEAPGTTEFGVREAATDGLKFSLEEFYTFRYQSGGISRQVEKQFVDARNFISLNTSEMNDAGITPKTF